MLKQRLRIATATSLIWIACLSACGASLQVKTWFTDSKNVKEECRLEKPFVRRNGKGDIQEALSLLEAHAYRCYSPADDEAWRSRMAVLSQCCDSHGGVGGIGAAMTGLAPILEAPIQK
jgi:hypothetical protein